MYYGDCEATIGIDGELLAVFLTKKQLKMVVGWMIFHKEEAYKAWNMAVRGKNMKEKVFNYLTTVPKGKVVTYGQIASYLGNRKLARVVGNILHNNPDKNKYPCYKVVNSKGYLANNYAFGGLQQQKIALEKEYLYDDASEVLLPARWSRRRPCRTSRRPMTSLSSAAAARA